MKTKNIFKALAFAMMMPAMLFTTACSSDDDAVNNNENTQKKYYEIPVTVTVTRQGEGTRATYDGETQKLSFSTGDKLFVNGHHETAGFFAGALDLLSASDGTFEGTVIAQSSYTGTAEAFLKGTDHASATLLPAGYENYDYLKFTLNDTPVDEITSPFTSVSAIIQNSLLPLGKAEAVAQLSHEYAFNYDDYVFALSPQRPVICCTINGLPAETSVQVVYDGKYNDFSGYITTDGSGTATFAFTDFTGADSPLGTLTVNGNAIDLPSNKELEAGKIYSINRSIIPAPAAKAAAEATAEDKGKLIGTDGNIYADVAAATDAGTTAVAKIIYIGTTGHATYTHGLALALTDEASRMAWQDAIDACSAKNTSTPVTGATWLLASQDQWNYMMGTDGAGSHYDLRDGFSGITGASNLQWNYYWSSTENDSDRAQYYSFAYGVWLGVLKGSNNYVRACLAF